ncbi:MAG: ABC transporter permease [Lachnospiraceae bacterium]|nr:ABC transporter permease [Lachnospiraceae bacterium]
MLNFAVIGQSLRMALQNIRANRMRSFLTMLGIIIGVGAVIGLVTIVEAVSGELMGEFSDLGAGTISIQTYQSIMKYGLTDKDLEVLRNVEGVEGLSPTVSLTTSSVVGKEVYEETNVEGKNTLYFEHNSNIILSGRAFNEQDMSGDAYVCIVDQSYVKNALLGKQVLGGQILLHGYRYTIIGIYKKSDNMMSMMSDDSTLAGTILVPYKNALNMTGNGVVNSLEVYVEDKADMTKVEERLRATMKNLYNENEDFFAVYNFSSLMDMVDSATSMMSGLLGGIASISLLVGGIGIMNMMLVSVSERTKEIGLRKALGATPGRIQIQFMIESIVLSLVGGFIGICLGEGIAVIAAKLMQTKFVLSGSAILLGFGFSAAVGIIFGWMPAKRASELNPIDALRVE